MRLFLAFLFCALSLAGQTFPAGTQQYPSASGVISPSSNGAAFWNGTQMTTTGTGGAGTLCLTSASGGTPTWGSCAGSAATALSSITAASAGNTVANGDNAQIWNWAPTTAGRIGFQIGETSASTSTGTPYLHKIVTLGGSTATPLNVTNSLTGSQTLPALSITPTWSTTGVVDAALFINATNTASGAASKLIDAQLGGSSVFSVDKTGAGIFAGHMTLEGVTSTGATGTGNFVFSIAPTITGHPTIEGVTSTGAQGTGAFVFATSPTITTPTISGHFTAEGVTTTGATGTGNLAFSASPTFSGTVSAAALTLTGTLTTNVTGGGIQCVHVSNTGVVSGTGSDCGSGAGGVTAFSGDGSLLSNSSSTGAVTATLANAAAHAYWGNNAGTSGAPGYHALAAGDLPATLVYNNQANTYSTGLQSFAAGNITLPAGAGFTATSANNIGYDSTNTNVHVYDGADGIVAPFASTPITGRCVQTAVVSGKITLVDSGSTNCGGGGATALSAVTAAVASNTIANGNNPQTWNWAQTTNSQTGITFGETTAATGTSDIGVQVKTITGSTAIPLSVTASLNGSQALATVSITPTWNTAGVVDAALLINPTNTASGSGSLLIDAQLGGTSEWKVDKGGNSTQTGSMTTGSGSGVAGSIQMGQGTAATVGSNVQGFTVPSTVTTSLLLEFPNANPASNQVMLFGAPSSNVSQWAWTNFTLAGMGSTFSSPLSLSTNTVTCPTCVTSAASLTSNAVVIGGGSQASSTIGADTTTTHALFATAGAPAFRALAAGDLPSGVVLNNQANTYSGGGLQDLSAMNLKIPAGAGFTATSSNNLGYDTTNTNVHIYDGADGIVAPFASSPTTGHCIQATVVAGKVTLADSGSSNCGGGGSVTWDAIGNPAGNLSLTMAAHTSLWTFNAATGAGADMMKVTDTASNTGTGNLLRVTTASGSAAHPVEFDVNGAGVQMTTAGVLGQISTGGFGIGSTAHGVLVSEGATTVAVATAAGSTGQVFTSNGSSSDPSYIDFPERYFVPAANCNNATAGAGWSIGSGGSVSCRAGTNNLGGSIAITDTSSTFATFQVTVPEDWNTGANPYIRFYVSSTDTTSSHTIIPSIQVACYKGDGSTTDDVAANAAHSSSTITTNTTNHQFWSNSNVQMNSTDVTGCVAGALMQITVGRATDTATQASFWGADITFPRRLVAQAN